MIALPFIFLLGLVFLFIGLRQRLRWNSLEATEGVIVKREAVINLFHLRDNAPVDEIRKGQSDVPDEYPTFQYVVEGKTYKKTSRISIKPGYKPGTEVIVYYDPLYPERAHLKNIAVTGTLFLLGAIFVIAVAGLLFVIFV